MTEITPERSALLLADASRILRRKLAIWPATLQPGELAAFMAGTSKGEQFKEWRYRIMRAIEAGHLSARPETKETIKRGRTIDTGERTSFAGMSARVVFQEPAKTVAHTLHHIGTAPAASWLRAAGLPFPDTVRAWLGPAWQEVAQKVDAGDTAPAPAHALPGIPSSEIIEGFRLKPPEKWKDKLRHINKAANHYTKLFDDNLSALVQRGGPGKGSHTWNPARFAVRLIDAGERNYSAVHACIEKNWEKWLPEFDALMEERGFSDAL